MVKLRSVMLASVATLSATSAFAACESPQEVSVPDGSQATMEEMLAAQQAVKSYMAAMEDYLKCLEGEYRPEGGTQTQEELKALRAQHDSEHNSAVGAMERVANSFNEQIREYKKLNP